MPRSYSIPMSDNGVPSSCAWKPRSRTCAYGTRTSRSKRRSGSGDPSSVGMSASHSMSVRVPPTRVSSSDSRRRINAHAGYASTSSIADTPRSYRCTPIVTPDPSLLPRLDSIVATARLLSRPERPLAAESTAVGSLIPQPGRDVLPPADTDLAVGGEAHRLQADRPSVAVGDERDLGRPTQRTAERERIRRTSGRAVGVARRRSSVDRVGRGRTELAVQVATEHEIDATRRGSLLAGGRTVDDDRADVLVRVVGGTGDVGQP